MHISSLGPSEGGLLQFGTQSACCRMVCHCVMTTEKILTQRKRGAEKDIDGRPEETVKKGCERSQRFGDHRQKFIKQKKVQRDRKQ